MDALTERTIRRLCERLEAFRLKGPIPALMAEFRVGAPAEETGPLEDFDNALWASALRQLPNGETTLRSLWLDADPVAVAEFRNVCRDAGRVAAPLFHAVGHPVGVGTSDLIARWLWSVFELAELRLTGTDLRLKGDTVWRVGAGGVTLGEGIFANPDIFGELADTAGDTRYWRLDDAVEASIAALDIAHLRPEAPAAPARAQTAELAGGAPTLPPAGIVLGRADLTKRLQDDWATSTGKRFLLGASIRDVAGHYGIAHSSLYSNTFWNTEIKPARNTTGLRAKAVEWMDSLSRDGR